MPEGHRYLGTLPRLHVQLRADRGPDSAQLWRGARDHSKAPGQHHSMVALSTNYLSLRPRVKARAFTGARHWTRTLQLSSCRDFSAHTCGALPPAHCWASPAARLRCAGRSHKQPTWTQVSPPARGTCCSSFS